MSGVKKHFSVLALFLLFFCATQSALACKTGCPSTDAGLLKYIPGHAYDYTFESISTIGISATESSVGNDDTSLKISGSARLFAEGNCGYTLQLNNVKVVATKDSVDQKITQSIQKPIHFSMVNGKLLSDICSDPADTEFSLNIKRGVASLFQSSEESDESETDVFGKCPTHTSITGDLITKVRNLNDCAHREKIQSGIINGVVDDKAGIKSTLLLQADYSKEIKLNQGKLDLVVLVEEYKFAGSSKNNPVVHAKVVSQLNSKNIAGSAGDAPSTGNNKVSIIFQKPSTSSSKNLVALKSLHSELVNLVKDYVKKDSAKSFLEFIRLLRNADVDTLLELGSSPHPNKELARKVYLDGLFRTGTSESAKAIIKQVNNLNDKEKIFALLSLNLVQNVDKDLINQALVLLNPNSPKEAFLSIGGLVSKYCKTHDCSKGDIDQISKKITDILKKCKAGTKAEEERLIYILKGISNTDHLASSSASSLIECASTGRSNRLRVAALQAFSAASCETSLRQKALEIFSNHNEDAELRIEAYLAIVNCPTAELANKIAEVVNEEKVNQVGGFITSHLKAIRDSTDSKREYQRHYLGNIRVLKKFPKDIRRFSFNNELSYRLESLGASGSADYRLIYSQNGFLPRSARLNITAEVFGTNFNVFETNARQENLENVLEYYLGPKGMLNQDFVDVVKKFEPTTSVTGGRARRSIPDDVNKIAKKYKTYGSKTVPDLSLDLSMKLFGTEMFFLSLGDNIPRTLDEMLKGLSSNIKKAKEEASEFNKKFNCHHVFMDSQLIYPSGLGIPLELSAQGIAASIVDLGLNVDINSILEQNWKQSKFEVKIVPSMEIQASFQIGFNAMLLATGLKIDSQLHSATGGDFKFSVINEGNGFNLDLEVPRQKLELLDLDLSTEFYVAQQGKPLKSIALKSNKKQVNAQPVESCFTQLDTIGITVCFETSIGSNQQQTGVDQLNWQKPISFKLFILSERSFNLKGYHIEKNTGGLEQWKLDYSTPNSKVNHDSSLTFDLSSEDKIYGRLSFDNSQQHLALEAGVNNDSKEMILYSQYEQNNDIKKSKIGFTKNGNEFHPVIEIQDKNGVIHDIQGYTATGKIVKENGKNGATKYRFDNFNLVMPDKSERVTLNGWVELGNDHSLNTQMQLSTGSKIYQAIGDCKLQDGQYSASLYVNDANTPQAVFGGAFQLKFADKDYKLGLETMAGEVTASWSSEFKYSQKDDSQKINSALFDSHLEVKKKGDVLGSGNLRVQTEENNFDITVAGIVQKKKLSSSIQFKSGEIGQYDLNFKSSLNDKYVNFNSKCQLQGNRYALQNALSTSWGTSITAKGELGQRYNLEDIYIDLQGTIQFKSSDPTSNWNLKVVGVPEKTTSEFKLQRDNAELIKYSGDFLHPQNKIDDVKIVFSLKNTFSGKADYKIGKNGKGELNAQIESQKEPKQKLEVNTKFLISTPKYDVETKILLNSIKKVYIKTENIVDKTKHNYVTKNAVEVFGKKFLFDSKGSIKGEWRTNGEVLGDFSFTCPEGRVLSGFLKRSLITNAKTGIGHGNVEVKLNDKTTDGKVRSLISTGKIDKLNFKTKEFAVNSQHIYSNFEGKTMELNYQVKHLAKDSNTNSLDVSINTKGELLNTPAEVTLKIFDYNRQQAQYQATAKYPGLFESNIKGNYKLPEESGPGSYELSLHAVLPKTEQKTFDLTSKGKFLKGSSSNGGQYVAEIELEEKTGSSNYLKFSSNIKGSRQQGEYHLNLNSNHLQSPLSISGAFERNRNVNGENEESFSMGFEKHSLNFKYGEKFVNTEVNLHQNSEQDLVDLHYILESSFEATKKVEFILKLSKNELQNHAVTLKANINEKSCTLDASMYHSAHKKGWVIHVVDHKGQITELKSILELLGDHKAKVQVVIKNLFELDFNAEADAHYKNVDNFYVTANWNSTKLKLSKYLFDAKAQGKSITLLLKNADEVIFEGTATYALKQEKNKTILEGQGQITYQGKSQGTNFKLIRQVYELGTDKEIGFSYSLNSQFGPKNSVSTLKLTNKDFNIKFSVCEEKKQCTNVQLQSTMATENDELNVVRHSLLALIDLRQSGYPYEFEFKSNAVKQGLKFSYSLDTNIRSNNNLKYQLIANLQPRNSKVQIILPSREILIELQRQYPNLWTTQGHYENSVVFYFDKANKPKEFTKLAASADISGVEHNSLDITGYIVFEHSTMRPLKISGHLKANKPESYVETKAEFDIFCKPENKLIFYSEVKNYPEEGGFKLTTKAGINSPSFNYLTNAHFALNTQKQTISAGAEASVPGTDLTASTSIEANKERVDASIKAFNENIVNFNAALSNQNKGFKVDSKLGVLGFTSWEAIMDYQQNHGKLVIKRDNLINALAEIKVGKELQISAESGKKKTIEH